MPGMKGCAGRPAAFLSTTTKGGINGFMQSLFT
jgi:hypothetical protein